MQIEKLSIKTVTVFIFMMIAVVAIVLSLFAGNYFRKSALDAQISSLSRVIEVASQEMLKATRGYTFDLGMKLGNSVELVESIAGVDQAGGYDALVALLDDPFINGFVGVSNVNMVGLRVYDLELRLIAESSRGVSGFDKSLTPYLGKIIRQREGVERLKAVDGLWASTLGPLYSTVVPVGGLRLQGYLEVIVDPVFNLPDIGKITRTPVNVFLIDGELVSSSKQESIAGFLPVEYELLTSDGLPAFRVVGYENVEKLNQEMEETKIVTISGFLLLSMVTLLFALWLFNRFLFVPVSRMTRDMARMAQGELDQDVNKTGLSEFYKLASSFNSMANQVRARTNELMDSQNRLLQLLDLDDSAILYFGSDNDVVYFNRSAVDLFGYSNDEMSDMDSKDLFSDDIERLMKASVFQKQQIELHCVRNDGEKVKCIAVIHVLDVMGESGFAIALNPVTNDGRSSQKMEVVEESLNSILELARKNPGLMMGPLGSLYSESEDEKSLLREQCVNIMCTALACWEHDLGRNKLDLAEDSKIWQVYIDKSTPTTRTLDKYLNIDSCPKNPRSQRVIDTAEFVLREMGSKTSESQAKLLSMLEELRLLISRMKVKNK
ncbi:MAG: HAMP domain-containing protein [Gammaproteobacteria bacterium]|nr:HAMP domain-containing protein [Gammaproteobacteria bacterium]